MKRKSLLLVMVLASTLAFAKWGQDFMSLVGLSANTGKVGDHFQAKVTYQIGWFTPLPHGGPITIQRYDVTNPQYVLFAHSLPAGLTFNPSSGYLEGTPTESGQWVVYPGVRDASHGLYNGHGYWWTEFTTDTSTGLVYSTPKQGITITITR